MLQLLGRKSIYHMVDSSKSANWNEVRNTLMWESLPKNGVTWRDGTASSREPMIDRACAGRLRDVHRLEKKAQEPVAVALVAGAITPRRSRPRVRA